MSETASFATWLLPGGWTILKKNARTEAGVSAARAKVLLLVEDGAPSRYFSSVVPALQAKGYEMSLATVRPAGALNHSLSALGCATFSLGCTRAFDYPRGAARLRALLRKQQIQILHAHELIPAAIGFIGAIGVRTCARILHRHHGKTPVAQRLLALPAEHLADAVMVVSLEGRDWAIRGRGADPHRIRVVLNGVPDLRVVPPEEALRTRRIRGIPDDSWVIGIVGRLRPEKGHRTLFDAAGQIATRRSRDVHVLVVGDGPYRSELERVALAMRGQSVKFHFVGNQEDIAAWEAASDVVVVPSLSEQFGLVAVEAMAARRPVVVSAVGGLAEIVEDEKSGLLVPPGDAAALADAIERLLRDPRAAATLAAGGRAQYEARFTVGAMAAGWSDVYAEMLAARS